MARAKMLLRRLMVGFTLVELLTVVALIILIVALAVPNFASMLRQQRWSAAVASLQAAILRTKTYCITDRRDHAVEFCKDEDGTYYIRIEAESAFLEHVPNLQIYNSLAGDFQHIPEGWRESFMARRDAWGADGKRLYSGVIDVKWAAGYSTPGWGHFTPYHPWDSTRDTARFYYDDRYPYDKSGLPLPWQYPADRLSISERENTPHKEPYGYQDVDDSVIFNWATEHVYVTKDNLAVDDFIYLPYDIKLDLSLIHI